MNYLLDVNALLAWHHSGSPFHQRYHTWARTHPPQTLATCALVELGFLRISIQVFKYQPEQAALALRSMKSVLGQFLDEAPSPLLPSWVKAGPQTTDGYLTQLAGMHGLKLATFDAKIPGSYRIP